MKFTYNEDKPETRECVAYIDKDGDLIIRSNNTRSVWLSSGCNVYGNGVDFDPEQYATRKFYAGDSITITF